MKKKNYYVYSISCPFTERIVYIGKTKTTFKNVIYRHYSCNYKIGSFIKSLYSIDFKPIINEIDFSTSRKEINYLERYWIDQCRQWGFKLFNSQYNLSNYINRKKGCII